MCIPRCLALYLDVIQLRTGVGFGAVGAVGGHKGDGAAYRL